jgi:8-oxo-dGTP pyrophosphatase MutT (NUDIX family)
LSDESVATLSGIFDLKGGSERRARFFVFVRTLYLAHGDIEMIFRIVDSDVSGHHEHVDYRKGDANRRKGPVLGLCGFELKVGALLQIS